MEPIKFPKTLHLPWSPGLQNDDRVIESVDQFQDQYVIVTEKMDGENTTMYRDGIHARSVNGLDSHPSRSYIQSIHAIFQSDIPEGWRICGENLFAKHSIHYTRLTAYWQVFAIFNHNNVCLSWDQTEELTRHWGMSTVPVLRTGNWEKHVYPWLKDVAIDLNSTRDGTPNSDHVEGYVVRNTQSFPWKNYQQNTAKYVRAGHVQTDEHWKSQPMVRNKTEYGS